MQDNLGKMTEKGFQQSDVFVYFSVSNFWILLEIMNRLGILLLTVVSCLQRNYISCPSVLSQVLRYLW